MDGIDAQFIILLVLRWLHVLAAITAVGGTIFARFVLLPSLDSIDPAERQKLHAAARPRWAMLVGMAILFLLASGLYNLIVLVRNFDVPKWYHPIFGIKFLLAIAVFAIASLLSGRSPAAEKFRQNARFWMNVNLLLALAIICLSGWLRTAERKPKIPPAQTTLRLTADQEPTVLVICRYALASGSQSVGRNRGLAPRG
jgi:uncharacterized membrane protein